MVSTEGLLPVWYQLKACYQCGINWRLVISVVSTEGLLSVWYQLKACYQCGINWRLVISVVSTEGLLSVWYLRTSSITRPSASPAANEYDSLLTAFSISGPGGRPAEKSPQKNNKTVTNSWALRYRFDQFFMKSTVNLEGQCVTIWLNCSPDNKSRAGYTFLHSQFWSAGPGLFDTAIWNFQATLSSIEFVQIGVS